MGWFRDRVLLLWEASAHKKMLLTLAVGALIFLGSLDQLKILGQKASSAWIKFPQNTGESIMISDFLRGLWAWRWGFSSFFMDA